MHLPTFDGLVIAPQGDGTDEERAHERARSVKVFEHMPTVKKMRVLSDAALAEALPWHMERGHAYHVVTNGEVDGTSVLAHMLRQQRAEYAMVASWCIGKADAQALGRLCDDGTIARLDVYTGEVFKASRHADHATLADVARRGHGRFVKFENHAKVLCVYGERFDVCIEMSANLNVNPRCENIVATVSTELCDFWKGWYDEVPNSDPRFDGWKPWRR
ncbi:MAG: hypothetical protein IKE55_03285 [Kiritimatiellae bacterium]|nr:hypothetical protein [Kiritimatiellia bacterium]